MMRRELQWLICLTIAHLLALCAVPLRADPATQPLEAERSRGILLSAPKPLPPTGRRFALCIGVNWPKASDGFGVVAYAGADAKSLGQLFSAMGYQTTVMTADADKGHIPSLENLTTTLARLCAEADGEDDCLIISFSGHGTTIDGRPGLIPSDYSSGHELLPLQKIIDCLSLPSCRARNKLVLLDACRSSVAKPNDSMSAEFLSDFAHQSSLLLISACGANQVSWEDDTIQHGRFTKALMDGIVGNGTIPPATAQKVSAGWNGPAWEAGERDLQPGDLYKYIYKVSQNENWSNQTPASLGVQVGDFVLASREVVEASSSEEGQKDIDEMLQHAEEAYSNGNFVQMTRHADVVLGMVGQSHNPNALALRALGDLRLAVNDRAEQEAKEASADPNQAIALQVLGMCEAGRGQVADGLDALKKANRLVEQDAKRWRLIASGPDAARRLLKLADLSSDDKEKFEFCKRAAVMAKTSKDIFGVAATGLGNFYVHGRGTAQDFGQARTWYLKAIDAGNTQAVNNLGSMYYYGRGVRQDYKTAMDWFLKAANAGSEVAMYNIGSLYEDGRGVPQDYKAAMSWFRRAVSAGDSGANNNIGFLYEHGDGVQYDYKTAMRYYLEAANAGRPEAMYNIGNMYDRGRGVPRDYATAMSWYLKAANLGDASAMSNIGSLYSNGHGVPLDKNMAISWFLRAADAGEAGAMYNIGFAYEFGDGVQLNCATAMNWYLKAAKGDDGNAMNSIGLMYLRGHVVQQDYKTAMSWFLKAAGSGNAVAMGNIGFMYEKGLGIHADPVKARTWIQGAADAGNNNAHLWIAEHSEDAAATRTSG